MPEAPAPAQHHLADPELCLAVSGSPRTWLTPSLHHELDTSFASFLGTTGSAPYVPRQWMFTSCYSQASVLEINPIPAVILQIYCMAFPKSLLQMLENWQ